MNENVQRGLMPVLALRGLVVFPDQTVHFEVGRVKSVLALEEAMKKDQTLFLIPQRDIAKELQVSLCKVTRGAKIMKDKNSILAKHLIKEI